MFRKFWHLQPRRRWDGTVDAAMMFHDAEWLQIDSSITSWLYNNISSVLMTMVQVPEPTAYTLWMANRRLFLDNAMQCAVYALKEFHNLFQGDKTITAYFGRLKQLTDLLRDVGHPISEPSMVVNALRGLNSKFSHAIVVLTAKVAMSLFLYVHNYLLQDESRQAHTTKMEAATALLAPRQVLCANATQGHHQHQASFHVDIPSVQEQREQEEEVVARGVLSPMPGPGLSRHGKCLLWCPQGVGLLCPCPVNQQALTTSTYPGPFIHLNNYALQQSTTPPGLYAVLYGTPTPNRVFLFLFLFSCSRS
jgi:hypothetical protein